MSSIPQLAQTRVNIGRHCSMCSHPGVSLQTPGKLIEYMLANGVSREDVGKALLGGWLKKCTDRSVWKKHPDFYDLAGSLLLAPDRT